MQSSDTRPADIIYYRHFDYVCDVSADLERARKHYGQMHEASTRMMNATLPAEKIKYGEAVCATRREHFDQCIAVEIVVAAGAPEPNDMHAANESSEVLVHAHSRNAKSVIEAFHITMNPQRFRCKPIFDASAGITYYQQSREAQRFDTLSGLLFQVAIRVIELHGVEG